jgi:hypothetical protein
VGGDHAIDQCRIGKRAIRRQTHKRIRRAERGDGAEKAAENVVEIASVTVYANMIATGLDRVIGRLAARGHHQPSQAL